MTKSNTDRTVTIEIDGSVTTKTTFKETSDSKATVTIDKHPLGRVYLYGDYLIKSWDEVGLMTVELTPEAKAKGVELNKNLTCRFVHSTDCIKAIDNVFGKKHAHSTTLIYDRRADEFSNAVYFERYA